TLVIRMVQRGVLRLLFVSYFGRSETDLRSDSATEVLRRQHRVVLCQDFDEGGRKNRMLRVGTRRIENRRQRARGQHDPCSNPGHLLEMRFVLLVSKAGPRLSPLAVLVDCRNMDRRFLTGQIHYAAEHIAVIQVSLVPVDEYAQHAGWRGDL